MKRENRILIYWRQEMVGQVTNYDCDMGHWEGKWIPMETDLASEFTKKVSKIEYRKVIANPNLGTRITYGFEVGNKPTTNAYVECLIDGNLCFRMVYHPEAIEWLLKNVPE